MTKYITPADDGIQAARQEAMAHLRYNATTRKYYGYVGNDFVEVDETVYWETSDEVTRNYVKEDGMSEQAARERADRELSYTQVWMVSHLEGVTINGQTPLENFRAKIEIAIRDGFVTRDPEDHGIAVKYIKDEYRPIAVAELDKQGK